MVLKGTPLATEIRASLAGRIASSPQSPKLAVILVGDDPASRAYVGQKRKACDEIGMGFELTEFDASVPEERVLAAIREKNVDPTVHGIIVQLPLPAHIDRRKIIGAISAEKDVDGFTSESVAGVFFNARDGFVPCTPKGIMRMISHYAIPVSGAEITVIGYGNIVGKPLSILLSNAGATVTVCHSKTKDLKRHTERADVVIVAAGKPGLVTAGMVRPGCTVIDVGINRLPDGRLVGDCDFEGISAIADISPVPGGVGPMTVAMLLENTYEAFVRQRG